MSDTMSEEQRRGYLKDEYLFLQGQYEDYDRRSLTIKGWVTSGAVAALALAFNASYQKAFMIPAMVAVMICVIWYLEAYWKLFQYALADRIRITEAYFRNDQDIFFKNPQPFQIYHWWYKSFSHDEPIFEYERKTRPRSARIRMLKAAFHWFVMLPYLPLLLFCAGIFLYLWIHRTK
jgi:hypothetical protein